MMSTAKLVGIASAVMVVGVVGGAVLAAPDQVIPLAQAATQMVVNKSVPLLAVASSMVSASLVATVDAIDSSSPRTLAMIAVGFLAIMFAIAALVTSRRAGRSTTSQRAGRREAVVAPGAVAFSSSTPVSPRRSNGRTSRPTPSQVHALAAQGTSLVDIARGTGLPVDAIALMLAVADPARQLPHSAA